MTRNAWLIGLVFALTGSVVRAQAVPEVLNDTNGYVLLTASDGGGTSSFNTNLHWSDGTAPSEGNHYLVNGNRIIRILSTETFAGDSLTLDNGRIKSGFNGGTATINDLRIYGGRLEESVANSTMYYAGNIYIYGTADNPSRISGCSTRIFYINSTLHGDTSSTIKVMMTEEDNMDNNNLFWCRIQGDNADTYSGRFIVEGNTQKSNGHHIAMAITNLVNLGKGDLPDGTSVITLRNRGMFFGRTGAEIGGPNYSITIENGGTLGSQTVGGPYNCGAFYKDGLKIRGNGVLYIYVGDATMAMDNVDIQGPDRMEIEQGCLRMYEGYACSELPILLSGSSAMIAGYNHNLGPITMTNGTKLSPGVGVNDIATLEMDSLTVNGTANLIATVNTNGEGVVVADYFNIKGDLTKGSDTAKIVFQQDAYLYNYAGVVKAKLLSAKNLGEAGGFTLDDFEMSFQDNPVFGTILQGTFSIEDDPEAGTKHLYWISTAKPMIRLTGADGGAPTSFTAAGLWENNQAPSDAYDYIIPDGKLLRARASTAFAGNSLTINKGGDFAINGVTATVNDLRMLGGGHLSIRNDGVLNILRGTATVISASASDYFQIEIEQSQPTTLRRGTFENAFTGDGNIRFGEYHGASANKKGEFFVSGDNSAFTGRIRLQGSGFVTEFKDANALGGSPATFTADALNFVSNAVLRVGGMADSVSTSYTFDTPNRGIQLGLIGGIFRVSDNLSLTLANPISGTGKLTKDGNGDLVLTGNNTFSGGTALSAGRLVTGNANALGTGGLTLAEGTKLRIDNADGLTVKGETPFTLPEGGKLDLSVAALDTIPCPTTQILLLPDVTIFDTDIIKLTNQSLNGSVLVTLSTTTDAEGVHVYVKAIPIGTTLLLL